MVRIVQVVRSSHSLRVLRITHLVIHLSIRRHVFHLLIHDQVGTSHLIVDICLRVYFIRIINVLLLLPPVVIKVFVQLLNYRGVG